MKPLIFISHAGKDAEQAEVDPDNDQAVERRRMLEYARLARTNIVSILEQSNDAEAGFEVWLDQDRIIGGDSWSAELDHALHACHGAVILLDAIALESDWVREEATILLDRASRHERLLVVPVFLGALSVEDVIAHGSPSAIKISKTQAIDLPSEDMTADNASRLAALVAERFVGLSREDDDTPRGRWVRDISILVDKAAPDSQISAAKNFDIGEPEWHALSAPHVTLADKLIHAGLTNIEAPLVELLRGGMPAEFGHKLIDGVLPIWVDPEVADRLKLSLEDDDTRFIVLSVRWEQSGREHLQRAYFGRVRWEILSSTVPSGEAVTAHVLDQIASLLREHLKLEEDDDLVSELRDEQGLLILVDPTVAAVADSTLLCTQYPGVRFVALSAADHAAAWAQRAQALLIEPLVAAHAERRARSAHRRLSAHIKS